MNGWVAVIVSAVVGISAYNFGYNSGFSSAPAATELEAKKLADALEWEKLTVESIRRAAPDPMSCLPMVVDGSIDLNEFCRLQLEQSASAEAERYHESDSWREEDVGR